MSERTGLNFYKLKTAREQYNKWKKLGYPDLRLERLDGDRHEQGGIWRVSHGPKLGTSDRKKGRKPRLTR